jgi:hypothetical protein
MLQHDVFKILWICKNRSLICHICQESLYNVHLGGGIIFLTNTLTVFAVVTYYWHISWSSPSRRPPHAEVSKWNRFMYKGPSDKSLFFHQAFCKIHTPFTPVISSRKCCWRTLILAYVFMLCFSSSVSWSAEMLFDVIQLETWASTENLIVF